MQMGLARANIGGIGGLAVGYALPSSGISIPVRLPGGAVVSIEPQEMYNPGGEVAGQFVKAYNQAIEGLTFYNAYGCGVKTP